MWSWVSDAWLARWVCSASYTAHRLKSVPLVVLRHPRRYHSESYAKSLANSVRVIAAETAWISSDKGRSSVSFAELART